MADDPVACTGDDEHDIVQFLEQLVPRSFIKQAFLDELIALGEIGASGDVPAKRIVEIIFGYDPYLGPADFRRYTTSTVFSDDLFKMTVGQGYIFKTRRINGEEPFITNVGPRNPQFPTRALPVPIPLVLAGKYVADPEAIPPSTLVKQRWNLVGAHALADTTVGEYLGPVTIGNRTWSVLFAFRNLLEVALDDEGKVKVRTVGTPAEVFPEMVFKTRFERLRAPAGQPDAGPNPKPSGDPVPLGAGLWLFMSADGELFAVPPGFE